MARRILIKDVQRRLDRFNHLLPDKLKVRLERANGRVALETYRFTPGRPGLDNHKWHCGRTIRAGMTLRETYDYLVAMEEGIELFRDENNKV